MAAIYLVRHGRAEVGAANPLDPGLDELGRRQAQATAQALLAHGPLPIYSSPLARARQTAAPLARLWRTEVVIEPRVSEIPFPMNNLAERSRWLRQAMAGNWASLDEDLKVWRQRLVDWVAQLEQDCAVFCHFIAINAVLGAAQQDERLVIFHPDNASVTTFNNDGGKLRLAALGREAATKIN